MLKLFVMAVLTLGGIYLASQLYSAAGLHRMNDKTFCTTVKTEKMSAKDFQRCKTKGFL